MGNPLSSIDKLYRVSLKGAPTYPDKCHWLGIDITLNVQKGRLLIRPSTYFQAKEIWVGCMDCKEDHGSPRIVINGLMFSW